MRRLSYVSHLECTSCSSTYEAGELQSVCRSCSKALFARYDIPSIKSDLTKDTFTSRRGSLWKYRELLPVQNEKNIVSLGEGSTPIIPLRRIGETLKLPRLWMKDEGMNPTGSFKARGMSVAISKAKELGVTNVAAPSAGNAGGALAAYAAKAGMQARVFMPKETPQANINEVQMFGAESVFVDGNIADAAKQMSEMNRGQTWFDCSTLKEPYRLEGKKTMGFEIAEQFDNKLPDVIVYPTGGGTGLIGIWKAFEELEQLGWMSHRPAIEKAGRRPRMIVVQSSGCAPIVKAFERREKTSTFWENAKTIASGLRVPKAFADNLILKVLYESNGIAIAVDDREITADMKEIARDEGIFICPEGAATVSALKKLLKEEKIAPTESVLLLNTATGYKYGELYYSS